MTTGTGCCTWESWMDTGTTGASSITNEWVVWNTATTATVTTSGTEWSTWVSDTTGTTSAITDTTWDSWTTVEVSEEPSEQFHQRLERERVEHLESVKVYKERKAKAVTLLRDALSIKQREDFDEHNYFYVIGGKSGKRFRIDNGRAGNVKLLEGDRIMQSLCAHPAMRCPNEDTMLVQKVMLEHMEDTFIDTANITVH